jgi:hypothetical protein
MNALQLLQKTLAEDRQGYEKALLGGSAKDFAEYRHLAGTIQGLVRAENHVKDLVQRLEKTDE